MSVQPGQHNISGQRRADYNLSLQFKDSAGAAFNNSRLAFYSIGESLNLALLDARVTTLINAFAAAIP